MGADTGWTIDTHDPMIGALHVQTFRYPHKAEEHTRRHFLEPREQWEDLRPGRTPADYRLALATEPDTSRTLRAAQDDYLAATRRTTETSRIAAAAVGRHAWFTFSEQGEPSIAVAFYAGLLCAFSAGSVSELRTAYRPVPRVVRGRLTARQYADEALRKVQALLP